MSEQVVGAVQANLRESLEEADEADHDAQDGEDQKMGSDRSRFARFLSLPKVPSSKPGPRRLSC